MAGKAPIEENTEATSLRRIRSAPFQLAADKGDVATAQTKTLAGSEERLLFEPTLCEQSTEVHVFGRLSSRFVYGEVGRCKEVDGVGRGVALDIS